MAVGKKEETAAEGTLRIRLDLRCKTNTGETVFSTRFSPAGDMLAAALGDGSIHLFNVEEGKSQRVLHTKMQNREERPCTAVRWRPNKADTPVILAACSNGSVQLFDLGSGQRTCVWETDNEVLSVDYAPDAMHFASVGRDRIVRLYDEKSAKVVSEMQSGYDFMGNVTAGHNNRIYAAKFAEPNVLLTGGWDKTIQVYDCRTGKSARVLYGAKVSGDGLDVRQTLVLAASCEKSNQLQLFDYGSGRQLPAEALPSNVGDSQLYACKFEPAGNVVWTCGTQPSCVLGVTREDGKIVGRVVDPPHPMYCLDVAPDGKSLACGGGHEKLYIMDILSPSQIA
jgi:WD40 repeat protein